MNGGTAGENLASKFEARLVQERSQSYASLDISRPALSEDSAAKPTPVRMGAGTGAFTMDRMMANMSHTDFGNMGLSNAHIDCGYSFMDATDGSPDSISLAFPPLPLSFHPQTLPNAKSKITSPYASSGIHNNSHLAQHCAGETGLQEGDGTGFAALGSYLDQPFPPNQRISVFSKASN